MATISLVNQKGGCSKSSTTVHLAHWLAKSQQQVLVVDADVQRSSSRWLQSLELKIPFQVLATPNEILDK